MGEAWHGIAQPPNRGVWLKWDEEVSQSESSVDRRSPKPKSLNIFLTFISQTIMSRFFRQAADSDSESSDSEESLLSSDEDASPSKPTVPAKPAMSRFLRTANASDSSSSEPESEDEDESEDEGVTHKEAKPKSRFLRDSDEEESDEEVKRVVKSARDKRLEEMEATGRAMDNALKINDWISISSGEYMCICSPSMLICAVY